MKKIFRWLASCLIAGKEINFAREKIILLLLKYRENHRTTLEIGCCVGETYIGQGYTGTDLRLDFLRTFQDQHIPEKINLVQADASRLPFADCSYQFIYILGTLELIDQSKVMDILRECARIGGEKAYFVFQFLNPVSIQYAFTKNRHWLGDSRYNYYPLRRRESRNLLTAMGFSILEEFPTVFIPYFVVNKLGWTWLARLDIFLSSLLPGFAAKNLYVCRFTK